MNTVKMAPKMPKHTKKAATKIVISMVILPKNRDCTPIIIIMMPKIIQLSDMTDHILEA